MVPLRHLQQHICPAAASHCCRLAPGFANFDFILLFVLSGGVLRCWGHTLRVSLICYILRALTLLSNCRRYQRWYIAFISGMFTDAATDIDCRASNVWMIMNNKLQRIWKKPIMSLFRVTVLRLEQLKKITKICVKVDFPVKIRIRYLPNTSQTGYCCSHHALYQRRWWGWWWWCWWLCSV
jgi:hypothetical protein